MTTDIRTILISMEARTLGLERSMARAQGQTNRAVGRIEDRFARMNRNITRGVQRMGRNMAIALGGLATAFAVRGAVQLADAWTEAGSQLASVSASIDRPVASLEDLVDVAIRSRAALEPTVTLYARLERALASLGATQQQSLRITELVNMAFVAGGQSAQEQRSAILQLSQALASGTLQGEELRAIRENAPIVAQAIADAMGVGIGALRDLGSEGRITGEIVANALLGAADEIEAQFNATEVTVAQAFQNLRTASLQVVGGMDEASGGTETFAAAINDLADTIRNNREELAALAAGIADVAGMAIGAASSIVQMINSVRELMNTSNAEAGANLRGVSDRLLSGDAYLRTPNALRGAVRNAVGDAEQAARIMAMFEGMETNRLGMFTEESRAQIGLILGDLGQARETLAALENIDPEITVTVNTEVGRVGAGGGTLPGDDEDTRKTAAVAAEEWAATIAEKIAQAEQEFMDMLDTAEQAVIEARENSLALADRELDAQLAIARARGDETLVRSLERELNIRRAIAELTALGVSDEKAQVLATQQADAFDIAERQGEFRETFRTAFSEGVLAGLQNDEEAVAQWFRDGATRGLRDALDNLADMLLNLFSQAGQGGKGGGLGGIVSGVGSLFGFGSGPSFGGAKAAGGPVRSGLAYTVGERGPETFVPNVPGMIVPNTVPAGSRAGAVVSYSPVTSITVAGDVSAETINNLRQEMAARDRLNEQTFAQKVATVLPGALQQNQLDGYL